MYRHIVDDHNNLRHAAPSIEATWKTQRWSIRVFSFLIAITEINTFIAFRYFVWKDSDSCMTLLEFRRKLVSMLINNDYLQMQQKRIILRKRKIELIHRKCSAPHYAKKVRWIGMGSWCEAKRPTTHLFNQEMLQEDSQLLYMLISSVEMYFSRKSANCQSYNPVRIVLKCILRLLASTRNKTKNIQ